MLDAQNVETLFFILSFSPGVFWFLLLFFPKKKWAMIAYDYFLLFLSMVFTALTIPVIAQITPIIASPTFAAINTFLATPVGTLGSWNHMILGDLWIGRWVVHDAINNRVSLLMRVPFVGLILFFGPLGLCSYLLFRIFILKKRLLT